LLGPDDKIVVDGFDDPKVEGVACHISRAQTGGMKGALGVAEDTSDASIAWADRPDQDQGRNQGWRACLRRAAQPVIQDDCTVVFGKPAAEAVAGEARRRDAERVFLMVSGTLNRTGSRQVAAPRNKPSS
jgi:hypothetical protein